MPRDIFKDLEFDGRAIRNARLVNCLLHNGSSVEDAIADIAGSSAPLSSLTKKADYLYETRYGKLDYALAEEYFESKAPEVLVGGCTAVSAGNFVGGNHDWLYSNLADIVVRTNELDGQYASLSVCAEPGVDTAFIAEGRADAKWRLLPFYAQSGINRFGVYAKINVVPLDNNPTVASVPTTEQKERLCGIMLVRYILDHFKSAQDAVDYLTDYVSIYFPKTLQDMGYEAHWMIKDTTDTFILEVVDNELVVMEDKPVMTNFYLDGVTFNDDGTVYTNADVEDEHLPSESGITPHGSGLERYNIAVAALEDISDKEDMRDLMNSLLYTNTYKDDTTPFWFSEYVGLGADGTDITVDTDPDGDDMDARVALVQGWYGIRERGDGLTWETTHSCVFDLENLKMYIVVQEDTDNEYEFEL